ncbi:MAG: DUF5127 domain-containing protein, partial [Gemmatimonadaceae bacterium]|nr:DUF5127 domain-containing protein [Chitinophagaceae bacterium]
MKKLLLFASLLIHLVAAAQSDKAPAYPLITHDPYFSIWSFSDTLSASPTRHWTGTDHSLTGLIKVDGKVYRFMGDKSVGFETVLPASDEAVYSSAYSESKPEEGWMNEGFDDSKWKKGNAPFTENASMAGTIWTTKEIWTRRTFNIKTLPTRKTYLKLQHDDDVTVYLNGKKIYELVGYAGKYVFIPLSNSGDALKTGQNILAIHVVNTGGNQNIDAGLVQEEKTAPDNTVRAIQKSVSLTATKTTYRFTAGSIDLELSFLSPLLTDDLELLSRPITYINSKVGANDGKSHNVEIQFGASANIAVNSPSQNVQTKIYSDKDLSVARAGSSAQQVLQKKGDDLRIDWGYMYVVAGREKLKTQFISSAANSVSLFANGQKPVAVDSGRGLVLNTILTPGTVGATPKEVMLMIGYDDIYSVQFFN